MALGGTVGAWGYFPLTHAVAPPHPAPEQAVAATTAMILDACRPLGFLFAVAHCCEGEGLAPPAVLALQQNLGAQQRSRCWRRHSLLLSPPPGVQLLLRYYGLFPHNR